MKTNVDIHADDYGFTVNKSKDILECIKNGKLDSFSIIPNTVSFEECMDMFYKKIPSLSYLPLISIHINLVEGFNLSNTSMLSNDGINNKSWSSILLKSIGFHKNEFKKELKEEIKAQIFKTEEAINKCIEIAEANNIPYKQRGLRIDSHTHTHSIPLVFKALCEVIEEEKLNVEYIRNPKEPITPFLKNLGLKFSFINFIKNIILNIYSKKIDKYCDEHKLKKEYMWGLVMSGMMDFDKIKVLYPSLLNIANKNGRDLELLFHPGLALKEEYSKEINKDNMKNFNTSNNRCIEKEAVLKIKEIVK